MQSNIQKRLKRLYSKTRPLVWLKGRLPSVFRGLHDGIRTGSKYEVLHKQDETAEILQQTALFKKAWKARPWTRFPRENRYYNGLCEKERINYDEQPDLHQYSSHHGGNALYQIPFIYNPYYSTPDSDEPPAQECFLDPENKVPAPLVWAYFNVPTPTPEPLLGSYELFKLRDDVCFERYGRYTSYGLGYEVGQGGTGLGMHGDMNGTQDTLNMALRIDWREVDLGRAQEQCYIRNNNRFPELRHQINNVSQPAVWPGSAKRVTSDSKISNPRDLARYIPRTCIVLRIWGDYKYTDYTVLYIRSLVSELNLNSGAEYDVHLLVHIKDGSKPIWASKKAYYDVLEATVPAEFRSMATLWSEDLMRLIYPGPFQPQFAYHGPIHWVARSMHMALQWFAMQHPEYEYFWNWEMDLRYVGHYYELFDRVEKWAKQQSREGLWERSGRFYIPVFHGNWHSFRENTRTKAQSTTNHTIFGPERFPASEEGIGSSLFGYDEDFTPPSMLENITTLGVGEDADYISFNPIFDPHGTDWVYRNDVSGYDTNLPIPPRRASIVTASRLSRRLLDRMHQETYLGRHSMASEMFPASMALHHGFKATFVPHPVYFDRDWPPGLADSVFNGGPGGASGGYKESVFSEVPQHNFQGSTFYYNSGFAGALWRRWLGYRENGEGGGREESEGGSGGRMCLRSVLLHPVKREVGEIQ
ncbi:hypothetical protein LTR72_011286 [Exophiala xenobiotica]|nr:hypothetical protein LTR72_011286 [Exophiala xenobiotica]KAK5284596.1 hypothetical protein LTR14_011642 [Exophiala xenobiotica]KAK5466214.1 hypothetical protein LTR55_011670 [Exophiala xenobiotica]